MSDKMPRRSAQKKKTLTVDLKTSKGVKRGKRVGKTTQACKKIFELFEEGGAVLPGRNDSGIQFRQRVNRKKRSYKDDPDAQTLRHISNVLFDKVRTSVAQEQEVQVMVMNDRLVVSANEAKSMDWLANDTKNNDMSLADYMAFASMDQADRTTQVSLKLSGRMRGAPPTASDANAMRTLQAAAGQKVSDVFVHVKAHRWAADQSALLTDDAYKGKIIIFEAPAAHAEQKIIRMLIAAASGRDSIVSFPATIWGKKRPCQGCLKALQICKAAGFNINYDPNPGLLWKGSCDSIDAVCDLLQNKGFVFPSGQSVADHLAGLAAVEDSFVTLSRYTGAEDQGAGTDSESDVENYAAAAATAARDAERLDGLCSHAMTALNLTRAQVNALLTPPSGDAAAAAPVAVAAEVVTRCRQALDKAAEHLKLIESSLSTMQGLFNGTRHALGYAEADLSRAKQKEAAEPSTKHTNAVEAAHRGLNGVTKALEIIAAAGTATERIRDEAKRLDAELRSTCARLEPAAA